MAEGVFRRQVEAFNARDLDAYLATYAPDAIVHGVSDEPLRGTSALRAHYETRLSDPALHCEPLEVFSWADGWIVARERVTSSRGTHAVMAMFAAGDDVISRALIGV